VEKAKNGLNCWFSKENEWKVLSVANAAIARTFHTATI